MRAYQDAATALLSVSKLLLWLGIIAAIAYITMCLFLFFQQSRFIFFPSRVIEQTPEMLNIPYEEVWLSVKTGLGKEEKIHGWWLKSHHPDAKVLLFFHGNASNIGANLGAAYRFYQLGFSVLLIDYRGYGRSQGGFPSEKTVYQDAATAWQHLTQERQIPAKQIFIYGHSLGGAIAVDLAMKNPEAGGLIVEGSFTSVREMISSSRNMFSIFPVDLMLTQHFDSIKKVPQLKMPVLFIHGTADLAVPFSMSQKLYDASPEPKQLVLIPGAGHNDVAVVAEEKYLRSVQYFVDNVIGDREQVTDNPKWN